MCSKTGIVAVERSVTVWGFILCKKARKLLFLESFYQDDVEFVCLENSIIDY